MDFSFSSAQQAYYDKCAQFAEKEITPYLKQIEEDLEFKKKLFQKMGKLGLFSLSIPKEFGGNFTDNVTYALAMIAIAKADAGITVAMSVTNMVAEIIVRNGTEEQKKHYLPKIASGEFIPAAFALTEKEAGSDAKTIQMQAVLEKDDYVINGYKQFISNADIAGIIILFAKTNKEAKAHGITAFLVEGKTPGFSIAKKESKLGLLSANLVDLKFENSRIGKNCVLGNLNEGFKIALNALDSGRIGIAAQSVGIGEAAYESALKHAKKREQFGQAIAQFEGVSFMLADMHVKLMAMKLLLFKACNHKDRGLAFTLEASEAKLFCSEACNEIANDALQIFGGYGYVKDYPVEKYFRDARATTLYEGTSEIQRLVIAKNITA